MILKLIRLWTPPILFTLALQAYDASSFLWDNKQVPYLHDETYPEQLLHLEEESA